MDAMPLVAHIDERSSFNRACSAFIARAAGARDSLTLVTATLTFDEVAFALMHELLAREPFLIGRDRARFLEAHADTVRQLNALIGPRLTSLQRLINLEPVLPADIHSMLSNISAHGLLPRDAIHVAVAQRLGIDAMVSDDDAFDRVPGLTLYKPEPEP